MSYSNACLNAHLSVSALGFDVGGGLPYWGGRDARWNGR